MSIETIDLNKCTGCGTCVNACPMDVIKRDFTQVEVPPCTEECPAHIDMRGYMHLVTLGRYEEAVDLIRKANPLFALTGYVCYHPCENKCARNEVDGAVNINGVERFIAEYMLREKAKPALRIYARKVAVIGSGPAGLAAAYDLVTRGYPVTVFESEQKPGGMIRSVIPAYRMPEDRLDAQIEYLKDTGVEFKTGISFGKDVTVAQLKQEGYEAVLIATGAPNSRKVELAGTALEGVVWCLDFLRSAKKKEKVQLSGKVLVIGGGNAAIDAAMTATRLGCKDVMIVYRRTQGEMPANKEEVNYALAEGVKIKANWVPKEVMGANGKVSGVKFVYSVPNVNIFGTSRLILDESVTEVVPADTVIFALGEDTDVSVLPTELKHDGINIETDPITLATSVAGVFSAGIIGAKSKNVIEAIASGKEAAESIDRFLRGLDLKASRGLISKKVKHPPVKGVDPKIRQNPELLSVDQRRDNFDEIKKGLQELTAEFEATRCMGCGSKAYIKYVEECQCCEACEWDCPNKAIYVDPEKTESLMVSFK